MDDLYKLLEIDDTPLSDEESREEWHKYRRRENAKIYYHKHKVNKKAIFKKWNRKSGLKYKYNLSETEW